MSACGQTLDWGDTPPVALSRHRSPFRLALPALTTLPAVLRTAAPGRRDRSRRALACGQTRGRHLP